MLTFLIIKTLKTVACRFKFQSFAIVIDLIAPDWVPYGAFSLIDAYFYILSAVVFCGEPKVGASLVKVFTDLFESQFFCIFLTFSAILCQWLIYAAIFFHSVNLKWMKKKTNWIKILHYFEWWVWVWNDPAAAFFIFLLFRFWFCKIDLAKWVFRGP